MGGVAQGDQCRSVDGAAAEVGGPHQQVQLPQIPRHVTRQPQQPVDAVQHVDGDPGHPLVAERRAADRPRQLHGRRRPRRVDPGQRPQFQDLLVGQVGVAHHVQHRDLGLVGVQAPELLLGGRSGRGGGDDRRLVGGDAELLGRDRHGVGVGVAEHPHQPPARDTQVLEQHAGVFLPQVEHTRHREVGAAQRVVGAVTLMLGDRAQLLGRAGGLAVRVRSGHGGFQDFADQVDVGHRGLGVGAVELCRHQVRTAIGEDFAHGAPRDLRGMRVEEAQQVGEVGGRAVHRGAVRTIAHVERAEKQLKVRDLAKQIGTLGDADSLRDHGGRIALVDLGAEVAQARQDVGVLEQGVAVDRQGRRLVDAAGAELLHQFGFAHRQDLHRAVQVVVQQRPAGRCGGGQPVGALQDAQIGAYVVVDRDGVAGHEPVHVGGPQVQVLVGVHQCRDLVDLGQRGLSAAADLGDESDRGEDALALGGQRAGERLAPRRQRGTVGPVRDRVPVGRDVVAPFLRGELGQVTCRADPPVGRIGDLVFHEGHRRQMVLDDEPDFHGLLEVLDLGFQARQGGVHAGPELVAETACAHENLGDPVEFAGRDGAGAQHRRQAAVAHEQRLVQCEGGAVGGQRRGDVGAAGADGDGNQVFGQRAIQCRLLQRALHERDAVGGVLHELVDELPFVGAGQQLVGQGRRQALLEKGVHHRDVQCAAGELGRHPGRQHHAHHVVLCQAARQRDVADIGTFGGFGEQDQRGALGGGADGREPHLVIGRPGVRPVALSEVGPRHGRRVRQVLAPDLGAGGVAIGDRQQQRGYRLAGGGVDGRGVRQIEETVGQGGALPQHDAGATDGAGAQLDARAFDAGPRGVADGSADAGRGGCGGGIGADDGLVERGERAPVDVTGLRQPRRLLEGEHRGAGGRPEPGVFELRLVDRVAEERQRTLQDRHVLVGCVEAQCPRDRLQCRRIRRGHQHRLARFAGGGGVHPVEGFRIHGAGRR
ncbi:hypothetical protein LAUMK7_01989 [Mycobacterium kansasii]|nr:hypothetical protein LAUMK40_02005 [Mycobacterium kansasii]VAZ73637.1 hypothetical protein LAUMK7_01989 [Mycobacterium kansasii]